MRPRVFCYFPQMDVDNYKNSYFTVIYLLFEKTFAVVILQCQIWVKPNILIVYGGFPAIFEEEFLLFRRNLQNKSAIIVLFFS